MQIVKQYSITFSFCLFVLAVFFSVFPIDFLNHDTAWFSYMGRRILDGAIPYVEIVDPNAPLAWLSLLPATLIQRMTGWQLPTSVTIWVLGIAAWSILISSVALRRFALGPVRRSLIIAAFLFIATVIAGYDFGQREHLFFVLVTPYVLAVALRGSAGQLGPVFAVMVGVSAALGVGIKPPLIFVIAALEVASLWWSRRILFSELIALVVTLISYVGATFIFFPAYFELFDERLVKLYLHYNVPPAGINPILLYVALGCLPLLFRNPDLPVPLNRARWAFAIAALGAYGGYFIQQKGWYYQATPALYFSILVAAISAVALVSTTWQGIVAALTGIAVCLPLTYFSLTAKAARPDEIAAELKSAVAKSAGPYLALSTSTHAGFPMAALHAEGWGYRYPTLIFLPGLVQVSKANGGIVPKQYQDLEQKFRNDIVTDIRHYNPATIVVRRRGDQSLPKDFNVLDWLMQDLEFVAVLDTYQEKTGTKNYRIFERNNSALRSD